MLDELEENESKLDTDEPTESCQGSTECDKNGSVPNRFVQSQVVSVSEFEELSETGILAVVVSDGLSLEAEAKKSLMKPNIKCIPW
jgi:hypothetical protein